MMAKREPTIKSLKTINMKVNMQRHLPQDRRVSSKTTVLQYMVPVIEFAYLINFCAFNHGNLIGHYLIYRLKVYSREHTFYFVDALTITAKKKVCFSWTETLQVKNF